VQEGVGYDGATTTTAAITTTTTTTITTTTNFTYKAKLTFI
jgi:hypothetical protein